MIRFLFILIAAFVCTARPSLADPPGSVPVEFLKNNCFRCHGEETQEAEIRLDRFAMSPLSAEASLTWTRVIDVLEAGEMPPEDEPQPKAEEIEAAISGLARQIANSAGPRPPALRRMNRREYENTVHDLLGIEVPLADLLPEDGKVQGFDKVADGLSISSVLMEQYLEAANVAFDSVIRRIPPLPAETRRAEMMEIRDNIESVEKKKGGTIAVDDSFVKFTPGWPPARLDPAHPIEDGIYRCRIAVWPHDPGERTLAVAIYTGSLFGPETRKFIGIYDVTGTSQDPRIIEFTTFMEEGHTIHIVPRVWPEHVTWRDKHEARPGVGVAWAETHGPLDQSFPAEAQKRLFGEVDSIKMVAEKPIWMRHRRDVKLHTVESTQPAEDAERIIRQFVPKAFRRPVSEEELEPYIALTLSRLESGRPFEQAVRAGVTAVLCSPQFLLLNQTEAVKESAVDDYTLAERLSYFLWSTLPDDELLALAAEGKLADPAVRHAQVERMVADPKIERFVQSFTGQWLDLNEIEFTTPAQKLYPEFDPLLQEAMLGETRHFFTHLLREDLSVLNFVDSDFTFLNERLARHYGIPGVEGQEHFRHVTLPPESVRGGVLTHASVLKVTANGTTTSPILRGVWVMDRILARPLPPPPPGVPAVEPDIRGAVSIRDQLEKHRADASCASCHKRIDPPGFALESFDAIGGEREFYRSIGEGEAIPGNKNYRRGPDVEPADQLADGRAFADFPEFRERLMEDPDQIAKAIATKLLVYGTGRRITPAERSTVEAVASQAKENDLGLRSMIHAVVDSDLFLQP